MLSDLEERRPQQSERYRFLCFQSDSERASDLQTFWASYSSRKGLLLQDLALRDRSARPSVHELAFQCFVAVIWSAVAPALTRWHIFCRDGGNAWRYRSMRYFVTSEISTALESPFFLPLLFSLPLDAVSWLSLFWGFRSVACDQISCPFVSPHYALFQLCGPVSRRRSANVVVWTSRWLESFLKLVLSV